MVQGLGGLGHLGVQFARFTINISSHLTRRMGYHTIAVSRGKSKEELAKKLGAHLYIDVLTQDAVKEIQALGGARVILGTVPGIHCC